MIVAGGLFILKMAYVLSTAAALPITGGALYVSTPGRRIETIWDSVTMQPDRLFIDLGCGDGRVLRSVHRRFGVCTIGYEINPIAYLKARLLCMGRAHITVKRQNFWKADLSPADVVFCYLYPDVMHALSRKLRADLRPGTLVISCNFPLPGLHPESVWRPDGSLLRDPVHVYRMPRVSPE